MFKPVMKGLAYATMILLLTATSANCKKGNCTFEGLKNCYCYNFPDTDEVMKYDCSQRKLKKIPIFPTNSTATIINLNENEITTFEEGSLFPSSLTFLDLSHNQLRDFTSSAFRGLTALKQLNLSDNLFLSRNTVLPRDLFSDLIRLEELNIQINAERQLTGKSESHVIVYSDAFVQLKNLSTLLLDALYFPVFSQNFSDLISLKTLSLSGETGICSLVFLNSSAFSPFVSLETLNLTFCRLQWIEMETFKTLTFLNTLDISKNDELTFNVLPNVTYDLQFLRTMKELRLTKLHCTFGMGTVITLNQSRYVSNTSIEILYLDSNRINTIEFGASKNLPPTLKKLYLMDNRFTFGTYLFEGASLPNITDFDGSYQYTSHDPTKPDNRVFDCNDRKNQQRGLSLGRRSLREWRAEYFKQQGGDFKAAMSNLNSVSKGRIFPKVIVKIYIPSTLRRGRFISSTLEYPVPKFEVNDNQVEYLDFSTNAFPLLDGPVMGFHKIKYLNFSNIFCSNITLKFFSHFGSLENLTLSYNNLESPFRNDSDGKIFAPLQRLVHLDISENKITTLNSRFFRGLRNLRVLDLHSNSISEWKAEIKHMVNLTKLILYDNKLNSLSTLLMKEIEAIIGEQSDEVKLKVDFSNNAFSCSCDTIQQMKWFLKYKSHLINFNKLYCKFTNDTRLSFSQLEQTVSEFDKKCNSYLSIILGISALILVVLVLLVSAILYRYRWKLRYLYYMSRNKYKGYKLLSQSDSEDYDYDVFVSYADEDKDFVLSQMMEKLEELFEFRLCLSSRDFQPGTPIAANITNAINRSRKTVAVITKHFLTSYWCMFEFNMARMESLYSRNGKEILLLIFYEKMNLKNLPHQVLELINNNSFIEFPHHPQGNEVFWHKIRDTINS
ncbi:hypothetical protein FSP39_008664 [Pinctada imbricata]|uniref:TIR domain-containing protein n=1 Tax=Pinctada imbricata TaxID=66713 RepID=A0AA88Y5T3_PINIB|nr:hypothetical protein FSP39_008664 [Pinctada imbricata]